MPRRQFWLVVVAMVTVTLTLAGLAIARVVMGGTGVQGALVLLWGLLAVWGVVRVGDLLATAREKRRAARGHGLADD